MYFQAYITKLYVSNNFFSTIQLNKKNCYNFMFISRINMNLISSWELFYERLHKFEINFALRACLRFFMMHEKGLCGEKSV